MNVAAFVAVAAAVGLGSAWYAMEIGNRWSTRSIGPWVQWTTAGRPDADPYARAHAARKGLLPISSTIEVAYRADVDSSGGALSSTCEYVIALDGLGGLWWSIAAYGSKGQLVANAAERYGFNTSTVMREADGRALVALARDARPGNWLPIGGGSQINVVLTLLSAGEQDMSGPRVLPEIQRMGCR